MPPPAAIRYTVEPRQPEAHRYQVSCTVAAPDPAGQRFVMAAWAPGSYVIGDFAARVIDMRGESGGRPVRVEKLDKQTWSAAPVTGPLTVTCEIDAGELSVRASHLDSTHGFIDGASLFPRAVGHESAPCLVDLAPPRDARYRHWRIATTLPRRKAPRRGFGLYEAADYRELIDHPVEMGEFSVTAFDVLGVPHELCITGRHRGDERRLAADLKVLCEHHARFFGGPPPLGRYAFLLTVRDEDAIHGLEHRASSALICGRDALPAPGAAQPSHGYRRFLRLCSHEYFHLWNGKRIVPAALSGADLGHEAYTRQLWALEGITSYYGDLALVRSGLFTPQAFLETLGRVMTGVMKGGGRLKQTLEEASFDAWMQASRRDGNAPELGVSYYAKGELTALALDLLIRRRTDGARSLDHVMRLLWERHGARAVPVPEHGVESMAAEASGLALKRFFDLALRSTQDLPLPRLLATVGIGVQARIADLGRQPGAAAGTGRPVQLGADVVSAGSQVAITRVYDGGAARAAGLAAGDVLVALDDLRITPAALPQVMGRYRPGQTANLHYFRRGELRCAAFAFPPPARNAWAVLFNPNAGAQALARRRAWLNE